MASCRIVNAGILSALGEISRIQGEYQSAGTDFISDLNSAISEMEGSTKDALKRFIDTDVNEFVATSIPAAINGMHELLEANRSNFETVDQQIADSIGS